MSNPFSEPSVQNPYASSAGYHPPAPSGSPPVIFWFKIFCIAMALVCFAVAGFALLTLIVFANPNVLPHDVAADARTIFTVYSVMLGFALIAAVFYLLFPILSPSPKTWFYGLFLLSLSLLTLCGTVPAVVLLIYWAMEPTRRYYGVIA
jgi:hypothetical protein